MKLFVVTVKANNGQDQERLIRAKGKAEIADYLLDIKIAKPDDVAALMLDGIALETASEVEK